MRLGRDLFATLQGESSNIALQSSAGAWIREVTTLYTSQERLGQGTLQRCLWGSAASVVASTLSTGPCNTEDRDALSEQRDKLGGAGSAPHSS